MERWCWWNPWKNFQIGHKPMTLPNTHFPFQGTDRNNRLATVLKHEWQDCHGLSLFVLEEKKIQLGVSQSYNLPPKLIKLPPNKRKTLLNRAS